MINAREIALKILYEIDFNGAYSNITLKKAFKSHELTDRDKALVTSLVYGVTDRRLTLDYVISRFSKLRLKKISKFILIILRMGIYQLMFMEKIPESAAVNESVKLAKRYGHGASAGFVNGVLHSVIKEDIEYPSEKTEYLSVKYSFPAELCEKWTSDFGYDFTEKLLSAFQTPKKLNLRPNTLKTSAPELLSMLKDKGINASVSEDYIVSDGLDIADDELYKNGYYTVQDAAAMCAAKVLAPKCGDTVIDMCAAPGGKTTHMAELMQNEGRIYAFDVYEHKIELIKRNAERLGVTIIEPMLCDGTKEDGRFLKTADKVLCDVPCSGLGIIGRKPEIKWNREDRSGFASIQGKILENGAKYLKDGGEIVYSTCTIEKEENEAVTTEFLKSHGDFEKTFEKTYYPNIDGTDGFYICKMRKRG